ncbi:MAG: hypothetical protein LQ347_006007 [Umbilicaria vellea]|nr:MAG: hypothetical protein LQ347_006007 [Umbilicaria vellea]
MNHASISPNGELLVAVGDEPRAFFCRRTQSTGIAVDGDTVFAKYEWRMIAKPRLNATESHDACFATAFSPSGHICAVASQTGVITIFDTDMLVDDMEADVAVTDVLRSSRPLTYRHNCGAVRSMSFGPEPWDLLAWAEDHGRVCVTDLRNAFQSRQIIVLDPEALSVERAHLPDVEATLTTSEQRELGIEARFMREFLSGRDDAVRQAAEYMDLQIERRRLLYQSGQQGMRESSPYDLSEAERQILDSLRQTRERVLERERADTATQSPSSVNYPPSSSTSRANRDSDEVFSNFLPLPQGARTTGLREYMRERNLERTRTHNDRSYQPRRRSSVVISNSNANINTPSSSSSTLAPIGTGAPHLSASPSRLPATTTVAPSLDPWQTISLAMSASSTPDLAARVQRDQLQASGTMRPQRTGVRDEPHDRARDRRVSGEGDVDRYEVEIPRRLATLGSFGRAPSSRGDAGLGTMGLGWSGDGRNMYVATEEGILEYTVNIQERKTFPGITLQ